MSSERSRERTWEAAERKEELTHDKEHRAGKSSLTMMSSIRWLGSLSRPLLLPLLLCFIRLNVRIPFLSSHGVMILEEEEVVGSDK